MKAVVTLTVNGEEYELEVDPQVRADQMGHSVDVHQNEYTRASLDRRKGAMNALEKALGVM